MVDFSPDVLAWKQLLLPKFGGWTKDYLSAFSDFFNSLYTCHHQLSAYFSRKYLLDLVIFQIEINKKHKFWKISYHSWFGTNDNKTSVIERKQNHKLWIFNTAFIRGFICMLNFAISWIPCPHNEINNNITVSISRNPGHSVFH